jgi:RND superfamily putative drug exporter
MSSITRWVLAHKRLVVFFWVALTLVGGASAGQVTDALKQRFSVPGKEGWEANVAIERAYGNGANSAPMIPVVTLPAGRTVDSPGVKADLRGLERKAESTLPGSRIAGFGSTGDDGFVSKDRRTTFVLLHPPRDPDQPFGDNPDAEKKLRKALRGETVAGAPVHLTGFDALQDSTGNSDGPGVLLETVIGGFGALLVLAFVFGSPLALVPFLMAIVSILTTFLVVWAGTTITDISPIVQFLVALIGLGVAIDYALLIVMRWREEHGKGLSNEESVQKAMEHAGRAVVFSGTTVAIGLLALVALPLPFLRSVGYAGMLIPLISVLVAITLLPVVLATVGPRLDRRAAAHHRGERASRFWTAWASGVVKRRWVGAGAALVVLVALLLAATNLQPGTPNADVIAKKGDAKDGLVALEKSGIGAGALLPLEVLAPRDEAPAAVRALAKVEGLHASLAPDVPGWSRDGTQVIDALAVADGSTSAGRDAVTNVRDAVHASAPEARVGGLGAQNADFVDAVYGNFPLMIGLIALVTFVLLARAFRSLLLPLKAVLLNIVSVAAAWGVVTLIWQDGHGSDAIWGIPAAGAVTAWIPLMIFAFLYGLSMDYEVFILARIREEYDATGSTDESVVRGIGRTGRLVTSAALILFLAFLSLASGPETDVKVLATGLAAGILLDATVVRALLVPAVVSLLGKYNWWLPTGLAKVLRVEPSPVVAEAARP